MSRNRKPDFVSLARDAKPVLKERNPRCDAERVVPKETIQELTDAGFFRVLQPGRDRFEWLDLAGLLAVAATLLGVLGHGLIRRFSNRGGQDHE